MVRPELVEVGTTKSEKESERMEGKGGRCMCGKEGEVWMVGAHFPKMSTSRLPGMPMWALIQCRQIGRVVE